MKNTKPSSATAADIKSPTCMDQLVSSKTIREKLGLGESAFQGLLRRNLPRYQLNKRLIRFRFSEVEAWLAEHRRGEIVS